MTSTSAPERLQDLATPAVLVDLDVVERNVSAMQARANAAGVKLRPHAKTHKAPRIGRMQIAGGASGVTLAKVSEAEVFVRAGFDDIFLGYPIVGDDKARRLLALSDRAKIVVGADSEEGARSLGEVFHAAGRRLAVRLKIDCGFHRVGVLPERALETASRIARLPGITLQGLFTHGGQGYGGETPEDVARIGRDEGRIVVETAESLRAAGVPVDDVSLGSTPTVAAAVSQRGVTECRPGTYVFNDFSQVSLGTCGAAGLRPDGARDRRQRAGSGPGRRGRRIQDALDRSAAAPGRRARPPRGPSSRIARLSEEHGVIQVEEGERFRVGQRVRILPNHACVVSNLHDRLIALRGDRIEGEIVVEARGCVQ